MSMTRKAFLLGALAALGSSCAALQIATGDFEQPKVALRELQLEDVSIKKLDVVLVLDVENPNDVPLELATLSYGLKIEGHEVARGARPMGVTLRASSTDEVRVPVSVSYKDLGSIAAKVIANEAFGYEVTGVAGLDTPIGVLDFPFARKGRVADL